MLTKQKFFILWLIGLMSGFTIMITGSTLNFWLAIGNIDIRTIGIFTIVTLPYALNFIWAPIFDLVKLPGLTNVFGHRLSWVIIIQMILSAVIYLISYYVLPQDIIKVGFTSVIISFLASSQDAALGGIKTEIVDKKDQTAVSGTYVLGYRIGMLISGSGAIIISQYISWSIIYKLFSLTVLFFAILLMLLSQSLGLRNYNISKNLGVILNNNKTKLPSLIGVMDNVLRPVGSYRYIIFVLIFLVLYRLPDNFILTMINPFLLHIGYSAITIATAGKMFGTIFALVGGLLGSYIMRRCDIFNSLLLFGIIHAVAHIMFIVQEIYGQNILLLFIVIGLESISGGITMTVYIAFITMLCNGRFRATQYAFFSSMMGLSRSIFPTLSGYIVAVFQWKIFFLFTTIATIPALIMVLYLKKLYNQTKKQSDD